MVCNQGAALGHMPDYAVTIEIAWDGTYNVAFRNRQTMTQALAALDLPPALRDP